MQSATPDQPPAASPRSVRLLRLMLYIGLGLLAAFAGMVLLGGMEIALPQAARVLGVSFTGSGQNLLYLTFRGFAYLLLSGLVAWVIYLLTTPPRRRYWIALGIVSAILISPAGVQVSGFGLLAVLYILSFGFR
jgi:hypothetical protein